MEGNMHHTMSGSMGFMIFLFIVINAAVAVYYFYRRSETKSRTNEADSTAREFNHVVYKMETLISQIKNTYRYSRDEESGKVSLLYKMFTEYSNLEKEANRLASRFNSQYRDAADSLNGQRLVANLTGGATGLTGLFYFGSESALDSISVSGIPQLDFEMTNILMYVRSYILSHKSDTAAQVEKDMTAEVKTLNTINAEKPKKIVPIFNDSDIIICPSCGMKQRSNRQYCAQCSAEFIYKQPQAENLVPAFGHR